MRAGHDAFDRHRLAAAVEIFHEAGTVAAEAQDPERRCEAATAAGVAGVELGLWLDGLGRRDDALAALRRGESDCRRALGIARRLARTGLAATANAALALAAVALGRADDGHRRAQVALADARGRSRTTPSCSLYWPLAERRGASAMSARASGSSRSPSATPSARATTAGSWKCCASSCARLSPAAHSTPPTRCHAAPNASPPPSSTPERRPVGIDARRTRRESLDEHRGSSYLEGMNVATSRPTVEVGIRDLKNNLSRYLERVHEGEDVIVTDRGRPVARLGPVDGPTDRLAALVAAGIVRPPMSTVRRRPDRRIKAIGSVSDLVAEQRR